jgi:hypothetical protein
LKRKVRVYVALYDSQVEDSGDRISQGPVEKMWESHRILKENTGNRWNMEVVFRPKMIQIFSGGFLPASCAFR